MISAETDWEQTASDREGGSLQERPPSFLLHKENLP